MTPAIRRTSPVIVFAQSPDDPLDAETVAAMLGIHPDSAYRLKDLVLSFDVPGVGRRWRRGDVLAYLYDPKHATQPAATCQAKPKRARGTRPAKDPRGDEIPGTGMTADELRKDQGYK